MRSLYAVLTVHKHHLVVESKIVALYVILLQIHSKFLSCLQHAFERALQTGEEDLG